MQIHIDKIFAPFSGFFFNIQMSTFLVMFQFLTEVCFMPTVVSQSTYIQTKKKNERTAKNIDLLSVSIKNVTRTDVTSISKFAVSA